MGNIITGVKVAGILGALVPIKYGLYHRWKRRQEEQRKLKSGKGVRFTSLTRPQQRVVLYYQRKSLANREGIYKNGARSRRRKFF